MPSPHLSKPGGSSEATLRKIGKAYPKPAAVGFTMCIVLFAYSQLVDAVRRIKLLTNTCNTLNNIHNSFPIRSVRCSTHLLLEGTWMFQKFQTADKEYKPPNFINSKINFSVSHVKFLSSKNIKLTHNVDTLLLQ
jgi:hypothetical protein